MLNKPSKKSKKNSKGSEAKQFALTLTGMRNLENRIDRWLHQIRKVPGFSNLPQALLQDLKLAIVEGVGNAFQHGACNRKKPAQLTMTATPKEIMVTICDGGKGYVMNRALQQAPEDLATHGRGLWIIKNLVDEVIYRRGKPNRLILKKKLERRKNIDAAMELFHELQDSVQALRPLEDLYEQFVDFVMGLFNAERASFLIYDSESRVLRVATSRGIPKKISQNLRIQPGVGVAGYVFQTARPLLVNNVKRAQAKGIKPRQKGYATGSFVSVPVIASPMQIGEETLGVLNLTDRRDGSTFSAQDLKLLNLMATQAASLFRIRNLIDQVKRNEAVNRELEIVSEIQDRMLPQEFPQLKGIQIAGRCQLLPRGGGDYFDVVKVDSQLRGVIADVSGHNVGSALTMASFRSIVRSLCFDPNSPGELLRVLRWAMHEELLRLGQFISCWVWRLNASGHLVVSGAGHPPVLIYREKKKLWESILSHHLPLGLEDDSRPQNFKIHLKSGDWALFYTDGLFDPRMRETGFDRENLLELVVKHRKIHPAKMMDKIFELLKPHHQLLQSPDDVAVIAIKKK